jgi:glutamine---fructose-6-phosphate transaminase (isomerizing)
VCGIFGSVSLRGYEAAIVVSGLKYLEYRGYDSWGVAVAHRDQVVCEKAVGSISQAQTSLPASRATLGHTRWATHGGVTRANAHPHVDCTGSLALTHNGIVENYQELRAQLRQSHDFQSETDSEVLVHLLEEALEQRSDLIGALIDIFPRIKGLSAVAVLDAQRNQVVVAKNGSPLALAVTPDASYLSSDAQALFDWSRQIIFLEDGQAASLSPGCIQIYDMSSGLAVSPKARTMRRHTSRADPGSYRYFMQKEIDEQPRVLRDIAMTKVHAALALADMLHEADQVYLIGCGTAHHAALSGRYMLAELGHKNVYTAVASEMHLVFPMLDERSLVIALSQSGETIDVLEAVRSAKQQGAKVAAIVNVEGSTLDRIADLSIHLECGPERCVLATKSYTAKLAVLHLTARALRGDVLQGTQELLDASCCVESLLSQPTWIETIRDTARQVTDQRHMFVLGRHRNYPLALEAALKIKEATYLHAEGFAAGELKHGVIALVESGTPCIILAPDNDFRAEALAAAAEVHARGALTIGLSPQAEKEFDIALPLSGGAASSYEIAATTQYLAYELALLRHCDPDKPRNLAKSVTVK